MCCEEDKPIITVQKVADWKCWYDRGEVYSSRGFRWENLPDDGLQARVLYYDKTAPDGKPLRRIDSGADWYWVAPSEQGLIYGFSNDKPEEIVSRYPDAVLKRGRWTSEEMIYRVNDESARAVTLDGD